jgi:hypothetical protein
MKHRTLGTGGLEVSAIGHGYIGLERVYGPATDRHEGVRIIRAAFERRRITRNAAHAGRGPVVANQEKE